MNFIFIINGKYYFFKYLKKTKKSTNKTKNPKNYKI